MKASDFNLAQGLKFNLDSGVTSFLDNRLLIFNADAIGLLRQTMIEHLGWEKTRELWLQFGYQNGYADFLQMKINYEFDNELELLASGPMIHTWEGIVKAVPTHIHCKRECGEFLFTGVWHNSYEAEQHLSYFEVASESVCWSLIGYASGWCSAFFGAPVIALEPHCCGKGDPHCEWKVQPLAAWGAEAAPYIKAYRPFQGGTHG
jgi:hypothetical protein